VHVQAELQTGLPCCQEVVQGVVAVFRPVEVSLTLHAHADVCSNWGNWCAAAGMTGGRVNKFNITKQSKARCPVMR